MENLVETSTNRVLNNMVSRAIREAIILQQKANEEAIIQKQREVAREPYSYMVVHALRDGVRAISHVLQEMFGELPIDCIRAIEIIVEENKNDTHLGYDSRDYVKLFKEILGE